MFRYTFFVHNFPTAVKPGLSRKRAEASASQTTVRRAARPDAAQILDRLPGGPELFNPLANSFLEAYYGASYAVGR